MNTKPSPIVYVKINTHHKMLMLSIKKWANENSVNIYFGKYGCPDLCEIPFFSFIVDPKVTPELEIYEKWLQRQPRLKDDDISYWSTYIVICYFIFIEVA